MTSNFSPKYFMKIFENFEFAISKNKFPRRFLNMKLDLNTYKDTICPNVEIFSNNIIFKCCKKNFPMNNN